MAEFDILFGTGISREGELLDFGVELGIVDKSGAWLSYGKTRLEPGPGQCPEYLKQNPEIATGNRVADPQEDRFVERITRRRVERIMRLK
ncbi:MAG: hypothetical protein MZW92_71915 [Comamonadaceae bacterium]|nr:hypothetical protein [Comamonadaceae bacterium]